MYTSSNISAPGRDAGRVCDSAQPSSVMGPAPTLAVTSATSSVIRDNTFVITRRGDDEADSARRTDGDAAALNTSDTSDQEETVLAVYFRAGKFGAAYFNIHTCELFFLDEIVDRPPEHQMLCNLFRQVRPLLVVTDARLPATFIQSLKQLVKNDPASSDYGLCKLEFVPGKEYNFEVCKRRIYTLSLPYEPRECSEEERRLFLRTILNFTHMQSVHALGALLKYLDTNWSNLSTHTHTEPDYMSLRIISLADIVTMDEETYKGLQIFSLISHPSNFKKGLQGSGKEGLSLFHLFNKCSSKVGMSLMRVLMQHPTRNIDELHRRQDTIAFCNKPENDLIIRNICSSLKFIKNVAGTMAKIKSLSAKPYEWKSLYNWLSLSLQTRPSWSEDLSANPLISSYPVPEESLRCLETILIVYPDTPISVTATLYHTVLICEMCENGTGSALIEELGSSQNNSLYEVALYMNRIIDFDLSKSQGKFTVKPGVDPELDKKKQVMASLHGLMSATAKCELEKLPAFIEECTMVYIPHLGYLLGVRAWHQHLTVEQKELPNLKFMNHDYIHYKSKGCEELDVMIGDTYPEIMAHETRIMMRLTSIVMENLHTLSNLINKCAELDCLIAISKVCREHSFVRPIITNDKVINIKQGKHPLHMICTDNFVPNNTLSDLEDGFVKVLTGPNSSGKSVYLKQVALVAYLAHIGCFVPADRAEIGLLSHIYSRIQSIECVASHMSAFLIDLRQMSLCSQESSSHSLVIIDEFGKGTSEVDGLALLSACLNTFLFREKDCPHIFISTHFLDIKEYIVDTPLVKFQRLEHMVQDGELVFLFRLTGGSVVSSFAHPVARMTGIDDRIVTRADDVMASMMKGNLPTQNKQIVSNLNNSTKMIVRELLSKEI